MILTTARKYVIMFMLPATHYISAPKLQNPPLGYQSYDPGIRNFIIEHEVPNFGGLVEM